MRGSDTWAAWLESRREAELSDDFVARTRERVAELERRAARPRESLAWRSAGAAGLLVAGVAKLLLLATLLFRWH